jgi:hypothetical protein
MGGAFIAAVLTVSALTAQAPADSQLAVISARLGDCSADFAVRDMDGKPIYAALVHVRIRYGFMGVKRMDLEVGTNSDGQARVEGLPAKIKPLTYDISHAGRKTTVGQDLSTSCRAKYEVTLK